MEIDEMVDFVLAAEGYTDIPYAGVGKDCEVMRIAAEMIIEELLEPLMTGELSESRPDIRFTRLSPTSVRLDFGLPR